MQKGKTSNEVKRRIPSPHVFLPKTRVGTDVGNLRILLRFLVCVSALFVLVSSAGAGDFDFLLSSSKLIDAQMIVDQFDAGETHVKVIVNLVDPVQMKARTDWNSAQSLRLLEAEIAGRQEPVLFSLPSAEFNLRYRFEMQAGFSGEATLDGLVMLLDDPSVVSVEPMRYVEPFLAQGIPLINAITVRLAYNGQGTAVAICDTGVDYTHPMLGGGGFPNAKVIGGYDFGDDDPDPMPVSAHGTCCAGLAAGDLGSVGDYIGGVAHNAKIYDVKIFSDMGWSPIDSEIAAWNWCVAHKNDDPANPIVAISNSWGIPWLPFSNPVNADAFSPGTTIAANTAVAAGITLLAASGNDGFTTGISWPAAMSSIISVGAVFDDTFVHWMCGQTYPDLVTCYSDTADILDILAPAENAYTTDIVGFGGYDPGDYYAAFGGTSAACPYAAGAVAVLQSAALARTGSYLTPAEVKDLLVTYGDPVIDRRPTVPITKPRINLERAIGNIEDTAPPLPDPAEWEPGLEPKQTGRFTIAMESVEATDDSGVEYYFECVTNSNFDSGWQSSPGYIATGLAENTTYSFRVKYRDTSPNQNEGGWSVEESATTDLTTDTSSPFPDPSRWSMEPRKFTDTMIGMSAKISSDENGPVEYKFECTTHPSLTRDWTDSSTYLVSGLSYDTYSFRVKARDTKQNETAWSSTVSVTLAPEPRKLEVPSALYPTIQAAIDAASYGDTVLVHPGTYAGFGNRDLDFLGKAITVTSEKPYDRDVVATTIIDCGGGPSPAMSHRAFIFQNGEGTDSVVAGFTIINGHIRPGGGAGANGQDAFGGAIRCIGSSPTIRKCVITDCVADGSGGDGGPGNPDPDPDIPGGDGGDNAPAYGGAIHCDPNSSPIIEYCTISNCNVISNGGDGGDGEPGFDPNNPQGTGGNGGNALNDVFGGAIYCAAGSNAIISNCTITDNGSITPVAGAGGRGETNGSAGVGGGISYGGGVYLGAGYIGTISDTDISRNTTGAGGGGGVYCEAGAGTSLTFDDCSMVGNLAAAGHGGGIWYGYGGMLTLNNCETSGNSATGYYRGGGIYGGVGGAPLVGTSVVINNSIVSTNQAQYGGGIYLEDTILTVKDSTVSGNTATFDGGGMCLVETDVTVDDFAISDNNAVYGGGVYWVNSVADFSNGTISGNLSTGSSYCSGAGLYCDDSSTTIKNCVMMDNLSDGFGGAVCFMGPYLPGGTQELINCLITDNNAFSDGAGLSCNGGAMPRIANCTIVGNEVPSYNFYGSGGGVSCYDAFVEIVGGILWDNRAAYGPQIAIGDPLETNNPMATVMLWYSDIEGGPDAVFEGQGPPGMGPLLYLPLPGTVIAVDPNFVTTSLTEQNYNYYLSQTAAGQSVDSPCVDTGNGPASALAAIIGFPLTTRTDHNDDVNRVDMGYHYDARVPAIQYQLNISVMNSEGGRLKASSGGYDPFEMWDPNTRLVNPGTVVDLEAILNPGYEVKAWFGTDDDTSWDPNNTVTMYSDKYVTVEFREPQSLYVPTPQYPTIQTAMDAAFHHGDKVIVFAGTYYESNLDFRGKSITVVSERPDDPCYVADTIIDCQGWGSAFIFRGGEDAAVIDGFTIVNGWGVFVFVYDPFEGYYWDSFGGAIAGFGESSPLISNCVIKNCIARGWDGFPGMDRDADNPGPGGHGTPGGSGFGGAIYFDANSSPTIRYCKIIGSAALGGRGGRGGHAYGADPGGVGWPGGDANDGGEAYGGAMYFESGCKPIIENCIIRDCNTTQGMGNIGGDGGDGDPGGYGGAGSVNGDESLGGAILYRENCEPTVLDTIIIDSKASTEVGGYIWPGGEGGDTDGPDGFWGFSYTWSYGGAHYYDVNCTAEITNCTISNNAVISDGVVGTDGHGGAEYYLTDCNSKITDCNFVNNAAGNSAYSSGGTLFFEPDCVVDINNSTFAGSLAPGLYSRGGAMCWDEVERIRINNSYFAGSEAAYGGALAWYGPDSDIVISNCVIFNNIADHGGGLFWYEGAPIIRGCKIRGNTAEKRIVPLDYGLIIFAVPLIYTFEGEFYGGGGGIFCWTSDATIEDCVIEDNTATGSGGGVYFGGDTSSPILKNCMVRGNSAVLDGGGIVSYWFTTPTISNCTIAGNRAYDPEDTTYHGRGGGLCCSYESKTILSDSIVWGNTASSGSQIMIGSISDPSIIERPAELTVSYCDIQGGQSPGAIHVEPGRILNWLSGNIAENPLFVSGPLGDYYLGQTAAGQGSDSPCVDAGSDFAANLGLDTYTTRTDSFPDTYDPNNPDPNSVIVDMGYHYRDASGFRTVQLTVTVVGGHGTAEPTDPEPLSYVSGIYTYYRGTAVILTATPEAGYRIASWSGTINDASTDLTNVVVMSSDKDVTVEFEKPRVISVPSDYPTIQRAIDAAEEGDQIIISPGPYRHPGYTHGASLHLGGIVIWGKNITLSSTNPDDPNVVANTILQGYQIAIFDVGPETVLTGFTMRNTHWVTGSGLDGQDPGDPGFNGGCIRSGAIDIVDASPTLVNIVIDDISIQAGNGGDGANGNGANVNGGNGGWGGSAYGGAIYIENGNPTLKGVQIINCAAYGGDGGDGGNGNDNPPGYGGRGGSWTFKDDDEAWWEAIGLGWWYPRDRYGYPRYFFLIDDEGNIIGTSTFGTYDDYWLFTAMGAALYVDATSEPTFIDCTFADNRTESGYCGVGGDSPINFPWPDYHHRLESFGTGIYCEVGSAPTFIDCNFSDNVADSDVPTANHSPYMTYGGGLACGTLTPKVNPGSAHSAKLINCTFTDNAATIGGGVFWVDTAPTIEDCNFNDNYAYQGGAMFCGDDSTPIIIGSTFTQNDTGYVDIGDPNLYYDVDFSSPDITLQVGPPIEDVLGFGGGMFCSSSGTRIIDCRFNSNTTTCSGGGIYTTGSESMLVKNCLITENIANRDGGGISANWNSEPNIINCTITENIVTGEGFAAGGYGGGVYCSYESYAFITNSIIWGNYALNGSDLAISTGFEHDPRPATVKVVYSDIKGGEPAVFVDTGCILYWDIDPSAPNFPTNLSGTSDAVPLFVSDYLGDNRYYLSQPYVVPPDPNQTELSPCVDAGSTDAYSLAMYRHTTRTDRILDAGIVDIGYHYLLITDLVGDFDFNYMVNISDLALFLLSWLEEDCSPPDWCHGADFNRDGIVNFVDYGTFVENYGLSDTTPPEPDPMTWAVAPNSIGPTSIYMAATTAYDNATGPYVEYYFQRTNAAGNPDGSFRDWSPDPTYTDTGLVRGNEYGYRVKACDTSANRNETEWSIIGYVVAGEDVTPPLTDPNAPNPYQSTWAMPPTPSSGTSILMVATTATDESGVEYYFEFTTGDGNDGHDSGWQSSPIYEDTGLDPFTTYTYRVRTRDKWDPPNQNYGFWSVEAFATTPEGEPPLPNPAQWLIPPAWQVDPNTFQLWHYMEAEPADDAATGGNNPCEYYFECALGSGLDSGWQLSNIYTYYHTSSCYYVVRYRDAAGAPFGGNVGQDSVAAYTGPRPW